jgi:hypothetical protein
MPITARSEMVWHDQVRITAQQMMRFVWIGQAGVGR